MDRERFDALVRGLGRRSSRRAMTNRIGAVVVAGVAAAITYQSTDAFICRQPGVLCAKDAHCCSDACDSISHRCACPDDLSLCGRECFDLTSDTANCGTCGNACPEPEGITQCVNGSCCQGQLTGTCSDDFPCCFGATCNEGACCAAANAFCKADQQCCSGHCDVNPLTSRGRCVAEEP